MIPLSTTTVSVLRTPADDPEVGEDDRDPYDAQPAPEVVASGVKAHIGQASGTERVAGGTQAILGLRVWCEPFDEGLRATDQVLDESTGITYEVDGQPHHARGLGLDHIVAPLKLIEGVV